MTFLTFDRSRLLICALIALIGAGRAMAADDARPVENDAKFGAEKAAAAKLPTLYIVGDSTAHSTNGPRGWAQEIGAFFDTSKINIVDRAIGGRSSRTFIGEGKWDKVMSELKAGDIVIVQFGHNDNGDYKDPAAKGRPSIRSDGEETADAVKGDGVSTELIHTFGWYMRKYSTDAKSKGATVILAAMVPHNIWKDGKISRGERATFVKWTRDAASKTGAEFLDLNEVIALGYEKLGPEKVATYFFDPRTHTTPEGAKYVAGRVVAAIKGMHNPLEKFLGKAAEAIEPVNIPTPAGEPAAEAMK